MSEPDAVNGTPGDHVLGAQAGTEAGLTAKVASSVIFVSDLDRSVEFYRNVFDCELAIRERDAALLLAPEGCRCA